MGIGVLEESTGSFFSKEDTLISTYEDTRRYVRGGNASDLYYEGGHFESLVVSPDTLVENFS